MRRRCTSQLYERRDCGARSGLATQRARYPPSQFAALWNWSGVGPAVDDPTKGLAKITSQFTAWVGKTAAWLYPSGVKFIDMLAAGIIHSIAHGLTTALTYVGKQVAAFLQLHSPAQTGPLSTLASWWVPFGSVLAQGMLAGLGAATAAGETVAAAMETAVGRGGATGSGAAAAGAGITINLEVASGAIVVQGVGNPREVAARAMDILKGRMAHEIGVMLRQDALSQRPSPGVRLITHGVDCGRRLARAGRTARQGVRP